jgi:DNA-binding NarL/FixJ family response regulator
MTSILATRSDPMTMAPARRMGPALDGADDPVVLPDVAGHADEEVAPARVLVVHNERNVAGSLVDALVQMSDRIEARAAATIESATKAASDFDPSVVLLDPQVAAGMRSNDLRNFSAKVVVVAEQLTGDLVAAAITAACDGMELSQPSDSNGSDASTGSSVLTRRQFEVLKLMAEGLSTPAIATRLVISRNTARNHVRQVLERLGAHSKLHAVTLALREGMIELPA